MQQILHMATSFIGSFSWLDVLIFFIFVFYAFEGASVGFVAALTDFISFVGSFAIGLRLYNLPAKFFMQQFLVPHGLADALSFLVVAIIVEVVFSILMKIIAKSLLKKGLLNTDGAASWNHLLGVFPGIASAFVLVAFFLTLVIALPLSPFLKHTVSSSKIGSSLVSNTQDLEKKLGEVFGPAVSETMNFLTVKPQSDEFVSLHFKATNVTVDEQAEKEMLTLVNKERTDHGLEPLTGDNVLAQVAREHAKDMFARGYFSHFTPEGVSPFDRMTNAGITFGAAGENLALAPNVQLAMQGLMNSPGHRANILSTSFHKAGIGVIDGGIFGEMFAQEFTD